MTSITTYCIGSIKNVFRFDTIFIVKDEHDEARDMTLARHVMKVSSSPALSNLSRKALEQTILSNLCRKALEQTAPTN